MQPSPALRSRIPELSRPPPRDAAHCRSWCSHALQAAGREAPKGPGSSPHAAPATTPPACPHTLQEGSSKSTAGPPVPLLLEGGPSGGQRAQPRGCCSPGWRLVPPPLSHARGRLCPAACPGAPPRRTTLRKGHASPSQMFREGF